MNPEIKKLLEKRAKAIVDARALLSKAEAEGRDLSTEEQTKYDAFFAEAASCQKRAERLEQVAAAEASVEALRGQPVREDPAAAAGAGAASGESRGGLNGEQLRAAFRKFIIGGMPTLSDVEARALQADNPTQAGLIVAPQQFVNEIITKVKDELFMMRLGTVRILTQAASLGRPALDTEPDDADWTTELATGDEEASMAFGRRELKPHPLAKRFKLSNRLLALAPSVEALVRDRLAYKFGVTAEKAGLLGPGAGRPLGLFVASTDGISTGRDISAGNSATSPTFDGLIGAKYGLKSQYWAKAQWLFHRDVLAVIAKLKDGNGQYIWRVSVRQGEPDMLLNAPVNMSEYAPSTLTTGQYVGIFGDFSFYEWAIALDMSLQRLVELYAATNQTGYIGRMELDGMPVLEEAFSRVKLA